MVEAALLLENGSVCALISQRCHLPCSLSHAISLCNLHFGIQSDQGMLHGTSYRVLSFPQLCSIH